MLVGRDSLLTMSVRKLPTSAKLLEIRHIDCPSCAFPKAVVAATNYSELLCFCPACQHTWDCANAKP